MDDKGAWGVGGSRGLVWASGEPKWSSYITSGVIVPGLYQKQCFLLIICDDYMM